jgi:Rnl2 family RNA ligase
MREVQYAPHYDFYLFDVYITYLNKEDNTETGRWLSHDEIEQMCPIVDFPVYAKALFRGTYAEAIQFPINFSSTIPATFYGLPPITKKHAPDDEVENIGEGVVIKPAVSAHVAGTRVVIKNKTKKFTEKGTAKPKHITPKAPVDNSMPEETQRCWDELEQYITRNRILNCVSKIGDITSRTAVSDLMKMMSEDVFEDFKKENEELWTSIKKEEQKKVTKKMSASIQGLVKEYLNEELSNPK